ncbi:hypothetical protein GCM10010404_02300 [Nonomuraea africana]
MLALVTDARRGAARHRPGAHVQPRVAGDVGAERGRELGGDGRAALISVHEDAHLHPPLVRLDELGGGTSSPSWRSEVSWRGREPSDPDAVLWRAPSWSSPL